MAEVNRRRAIGQKYEVKSNFKDQPIKTNRNKFTSYIGVVAKGNVSITIRHWNDASLTMKNYI